jgi:hypothetical protein
VQRNPDETVTAATPESVPGFFLTRGADIHGRCVALVGRGEPPGASGTENFVDVALLKTTANHHLLSAGLAYPTYYRNLFPDLRAELTATVHQAQAAPVKGLWSSDATTIGAKVTGLSSLTDDVVILPKLFRRLVDYLQLGGGDPSLAGFPAFLAQARDRFFILSTGHSTTGLDAVVEIVNGDTVRMTRPAEDLVFDEA